MKQITLEEAEAINNLLAVLHRDGGHYQQRYGLEKAATDAQELIHTEWVNKDQLTELKTALRNVMDACEDKNGQFSAWHKHLREQTKAAKELLK